MNDKNIEFDIKITIQGNGSSLWAGKDSEGEWEITHGILHGCTIDEFADDGGIWHLQLFGPRTHWKHYTDKLIEKEVNKLLREFVSEKIENPVVDICWSERDMQPSNGWDFDVCLPRKEREPEPDKMQQIEYLLAYEDKTWDTQVVEVPESVGQEREDLVSWAEENLSRQARYRKVITFALYHIQESE